MSSVCCLLLLSCGSAQDDPGNTDQAPATQSPAAARPAPADSSEPTTDSGADPAASDDGDTPVDSDEARPPATGALPWTAQDTRIDRSTAGVSVLKAVRTARHDGFDRVVLDFGTDPVPGYSIAYIDSPVRQCGSGNAVAIAGDGWLQIEATPAHAHTEQGRPTVTSRSREPGLPNIRQLELTCDFEAHVVWVAGVAAPTRYRAFELASPNRLVVDIRHAGGS